ncbi:hypothetical protein [Streptomyces sp. NPDC059092]|uniref:hypothetical protein n=1 Tax=Streptomyces sp. NPDC059092 TaxID=3346725 RepID=UPI003687373A
MSLDGMEEAYGAVLVIMLHRPGAYPDTAMSVVITAPLPCTAVAVAVNLRQMRAARFDGAKLRGAVAKDVMDRVSQPLRAVLDLY